MLRSIWYVATRGSVFLRRTSIAAMPMPIRSSERNRSSASCCVSPIAIESFILSRNLLVRGIYPADEFEFPESRNQTGAEALLKIQVQARQIFLIERIINILGQISLERAWRQIELQRRAFGNFANVREAIFPRRLKVRDDFRRDRAAMRHPNRQHARMAGHFAPLLHDVVNEQRLDTFDQRLPVIPETADPRTRQLCFELIQP